MKKLFKALIPVFFATTIVLPSEILANQVQEAEDIAEGQKSQSCESDNYSLTFLNGDFGLSLILEDLTGNPESMVLMITNPQGKIVRDAQVITSIIGQDGLQTMQKAQPFKGAYLIKTRGLMPGHYRLEAEVVTNGLMLTDEFNFHKT